MLTREDNYLFIQAVNARFLFADYMKAKDQFEQ